MKNVPITLFDLELTGLDPTRHEIIEIAALILEQPKIVVIDTFEAKIKPLHIETADPEALEVNGYRPEAWSGALPAEEALMAFAQRSKNTVLCGQNVAFDWAFLVKAFKDHEIPYKYHHHILDVMSMAFLKWYDRPDLKRFGLTEMTRVLGVERGQAHHAMDDVKATYEVLKKLWPSS